VRSLSKPTDSAATWAPEHLGSFVEQVRDDRFFALWMLVATSGICLETLTGLLREDIDLCAGHISPSTLGDTGRGRTTTCRSYVLDPSAYDVLKKHVVEWEQERQVLRQETQALFVWSNGEQVDVGAVRTMFRQHCSLAGLPVVPLQAMRQAYIVAAIDSGIPVKEISDRLSNNVEPQTLGTSRGADRPAVGGPQRIAKSQGGSWSCRSRSY
jgi:site-specific recombinase XerC